MTEKCPKCGSGIFSIRRDMKATRRCAKCHTQWLPTGREKRYPEMIERTIIICKPCYELIGEMCNTPECVFCRRTLKEVKSTLDTLLIRPLVDGEILKL